MKEQTEEEKKTQQSRLRIFTTWQKEMCWQKVRLYSLTLGGKARPIYGRDPERWRLDALGNPVMNALRGCPGPYCHEYDHIVPFSKGGETVVENCQILQSSVNRYKSNKTELTMDEMNTASTKVTPTRKDADNNAVGLVREMDFLEYAAYGNVRRVDESFSNHLD